MDVDLSFTDRPRQRLEAVIMQLHDLGAPGAASAYGRVVAGGVVAGGDALGALRSTVDRLRAAVSAMAEGRADDALG